jgi:hypothetical protein
MAALHRACRPFPGQDSAEEIWRYEVSRILKKMALSTKGEETIEQLSHSIVAELLLGPISEVMTRAEIWTFHRGR